MAGMARPLRIDIEDGWHHVMNRGADHARVFLDDTDRIEFGTRLADIHDRFGVETHGYCLLTTHFHAVAALPPRRVVRCDAAARLALHPTRERPGGRDGALFSGRFHSKSVQDDRPPARRCPLHPPQCAGPVGVDHVERTDGRAIAPTSGCGRCHPWLRTDVVLSHFGNDIARRSHASSKRLHLRRLGADRRISLRCSSCQPRSCSNSDSLTTDAEQPSLARSRCAGQTNGLVYDANTLMDVLDVPSAGALRTARSRARSAPA
jgi:hypothetical protein